jgi:Transposase DNA-binding/Transposase Tn5 dimerisation domain
MEEASVVPEVVMRTYAPLPKRCGLGDVRLERRVQTMVEQFSDQPNCTIPQATENRNDMDAAYNFFANTRVTHGGVLNSFLPQTQQLIAEQSRILVIQDTTDCNYDSLEDTVGLGYTDGADVRGLMVHSSVALTPEGLPLGLLTQQIWTRDPKDKGRNHSRHRRAMADKESYRWIDHAQAARQVLSPEVQVLHIADRDGDIYDWFVAPRPDNAHLLVRVAQVGRIVVTGPEGQERKLGDVVRSQEPLGTYELTVPRADDRPARVALMAVRVAAVRMVAPRHAKKRKQLPTADVWVIEARELNPPTTETLCWLLVTTQPITKLEEAIQALREYALRWRIERFHFVLKSGCQVEQLQLETADRLSNAVAVYSQVAVRLLRLTYLARVAPQTPVQEEFTPDEIAVLDHCRQHQEKNQQAQVTTIQEAVRVIARLGGHLGRKGDGPPGAKTLWRGLRRLHDLVIGKNINNTKVNRNTRNE